MIDAYSDVMAMEVDLVDGDIARAAHAHAVAMTRLRSMRLRSWLLAMRLQQLQGLITRTTWKLPTAAVSIMVMALFPACALIIPFGLLLVGTVGLLILETRGIYYRNRREDADEDAGRCLYRLQRLHARRDGQVRLRERCRSQEHARSA